jgi:peptide/nickel transport system permease protein
VNAAGESGAVLLSNPTLGAVRRVTKHYVVRRLALLPFLLLGMTLITFVLSRLVTGDPVVAMLGDRGSDNPEAYAAGVRKLGLDQPLPVQYFLYLGRLFTGDLGTSAVSGQPVSKMLIQAFPATVELAIAALLIATITGVTLGVIAATRRGSIVDWLISTWSLISVASPAFVIALIALQVFYLQLGWAAGAGQFDPFVIRPPDVTGMATVDSLLAGNMSAFWSALHHLAFPAAILGILQGGYFARFTRDTMSSALGKNFIRTARGKGLRRPQIVWRHAFRESLVPMIGLLGLTFGELVSGAITVETIAGWPGIGQLIFTAASRLDYVTLMGGVLVLSFSYIVINLVVDLLYTRADPRIRMR